MAFESLKMLSDSSALDFALARRLQGLVLHKVGLTGAALRNMLDVLDCIRESKGQEQEAVRIIADWPCKGPSGWRSGEVAITQEIGLMYIESGEYDTSTLWSKRSLALANSIGDVEGASIALSNHGKALYYSKKYIEAITTFKDGLSRAISVGRKSTEGRCLLGLAQAYAYVGEVTKSRKNALLSEEIFRQLGMSIEHKEALSLLVDKTSKKQFAFWK